MKKIISGLFLVGALSLGSAAFADADVKEDLSAEEVRQIEEVAAVLDAFGEEFAKELAEETVENS